MNIPVETDLSLTSITTMLFECALNIIIIKNHFWMSVECCGKLRQQSRCICFRFDCLLCSFAIVDLSSNAKLLKSDWHHRFRSGLHWAQYSVCLAYIRCMLHRFTAMWVDSIWVIWWKDINVQWCNGMLLDDKLHYCSTSISFSIITAKFHDLWTMLWTCEWCDLIVNDKEW